VFNDRLRCKLVRLFKMEELMLATPGGVKAVEFSKRLGVNRRTVYRDIDVLCEIGVPIWQDGARFGIHGSYKIPDYRNQVMERLDGVYARILAAIRQLPAVCDGSEGLSYAGGYGE